MRTKIYSVYVKKDSKNPLDTAVFIKQGFSFWAFLLGPVWAAYNRLWLTFLALMVLCIILSMSEGAEFTWVSILLNIWFGFEANNFKSRKLERRGYLMFDVVTGLDKLAAQARFYDKYLTGKQMPSSKSGNMNYAI